MLCFFRNPAIGAMFSASPETNTDVKVILLKPKYSKQSIKTKEKNYKERMRTEKQNKRAVSKEIRSDQIVLGFNFPLRLTRRVKQVFLTNDITKNISPMYNPGCLFTLDKKLLI